MHNSPKGQSILQQPFIPTSSLDTALRVTLIVIFILAALYCAINAAIISLMFVVLFFAFANLFAINFFAALIGFAAFAYPAVIYLILFILSCIFTKRLIKKQPLSQVQLITYIVLVAFQIMLIKIFPTFFSLIASATGA